MAYKNAKNVLPEHLLKELQKYADGELLYIPSKNPEKVEWGALSGARREYAERNRRIKNLYEEKVSCDKLADMFCLSIDSIRKIVR